MKNPSFVDTHELHDAFVGNKLLRFMDVLGAQSEDLLASAGLSFPSRASSTILLISEVGDVTTADIARELQQPHQLATQRVEALVKLGLLRRKTDRADARRKVLVLTKKGKREAEILLETLRKADRLFKALFKEIGADFSDVAFRAKAALEEKSMIERISGLKETD